MSTMTVSYFFFIVVYDVQKIIQSIFSNEHNRGSTYTQSPDIEERVLKIYGNGEPKDCVCQETNFVRSRIKINNSVGVSTNLDDRRPSLIRLKGQDWKFVNTDAWVILLTTSFECFIEGESYGQISSLPYFSRNGLHADITGRHCCWLFSSFCDAIKDDTSNNQRV